MKKLTKVLVTGAAGFIGFHVVQRLLQEGYHVMGLDNINNYYSQDLKRNRIKEINKSKNSKNFIFQKTNINTKKALNDIKEYNPKYIIHLAAQAGVRNSILYPHEYLNNNFKATLNLFELTKNIKDFEHIVYASTSSVYGLSENYPLKEDDSTNHPMQFYAVTKKATELMAHSYAGLFGVPSTGLRFFTVYGPWGRPDMALFKFTKAILEGKKLDVFGHGKHIRDFTYVDDIVAGIMTILTKPPKKNKKYVKSSIPSGESIYPYRILNIGGGNPIPLMKFIKEIELNLEKKATIDFHGIQPGDILKTESCTEKISNFGYNPSTSYQVGIKKFIDWYKIHYSI